MSLMYPVKVNLTVEEQREMTRALRDTVIEYRTGKEDYKCYTHILALSLFRLYGEQCCRFCDSVMVQGKSIRIWCLERRRGLFDLTKGLDLFEDEDE